MIAETIKTEFFSDYRKNGFFFSVGFTIMMLRTSLSTNHIATSLHETFSLVTNQSKAYVTYSSFY